MTPPPAPTGARRPFGDRLTEAVGQAGSPPAEQEAKDLRRRLLRMILDSEQLRRTDASPTTIQRPTTIQN